MFDGSKMSSPSVAGVPLTLTTPLTVASVFDESTEPAGGPSPHPPASHKVAAAARPAAVRLAYRMNRSRALQWDRDRKRIGRPGRAGGCGRRDATSIAQRTGAHNPIISSGPGPARPPRG